MIAMKPCINPEDTLVLLKMAVWNFYKWSPLEFSLELAITPAELECSLERLTNFGIIDRSSGKIHFSEFKYFILYNIQHMFPVKPGPIVRGVSTGVKSAHFFIPGIPYVSAYVWPSSDGAFSGFEVNPLSPNCRFAVMNDPHLKRLMAITETMRLFGNKSRNWASTEIDRLFI